MVNSQSIGQNPNNEKQDINQKDTERPNKKVLIVSQTILTDGRDLCAEMQHFGYDAKIISHPRFLSEELEQHPFDVVVSGLSFDGDTDMTLNILGELHEHGNLSMPLIIHTSVDTIEARLGAVRAGAQAYLVKPVDTADMVSVFDDVTHRTVSEPFRILVVDDDLSVASFTSSHLQGAGMQTKVITDPMTVLEAIKDFSPELILLDIYMPKCDGKEIAAVIRQQKECAAIPIVFLSNESDKDKQLLAMKLGGDDFLTKPIRPSHLISSLNIRASRFRDLRTYMARDSMTGLYNHTTTKQLLEAELSRVGRSGGKLSLISMDLDFFKNVNDTYGHAVGDRVIKVLARLLRQRLRGADVIGRMGGEEFSAILPQTDAIEAKNVFEEIRHDFSEIVFNGEGKNTFNVTLSIGVSEYKEGVTTTQLSDASDKALYAAKRAGRNRVVIV